MSTEEEVALKQIAINFSNREQPQNWFFSHSVGRELKENQELLPHCSTASGHWSLFLSLPKTLSASRIWEQEALRLLESGSKYSANLELLTT